MKTLRLLPIALLGLIAGCATQGDAGAKKVTRTDVIFDHPENFSDVKDSSTPTDKGRDAILSNIRGYLAERADPMLPEGYRLKVVFTNIHLAGDFEPWRGVEWADVRIVKAVYPPSFKFTYEVTDAAGNVVKHGEENILDMAFQDRIAFPPDDPLRYEKDILNDWVRSSLRDLKKA